MGRFYAFCTYLWDTNITVRQVKTAIPKTKPGISKWNKKVWTRTSILSLVLNRHKRIVEVSKKKKIIFVWLHGVSRFNTFSTNDISPNINSRHWKHGLFFIEWVEPVQPDAAHPAPRFYAKLGQNDHIYKKKIYIP